MTVASAPARRAAPAGLLGIGCVIAGAVLLPLVFLLLEASQVGWATLRPLLFRHLTLELLWNTVRLTFAVTLICAVLGVAAAWCIERTDLPWRRFWAVVLVLPLAMPDFVLGYSWISIAPGVSGYWGSVLVMSLGSYPLVYLPVAAALRTADPSLEDVARGLGPRPDPDVHAGDAAPDPPGALRRLAARGADPARRVRDVRDPPLPDVHDPDLHGDPDRVLDDGRLRPLARARLARAARARRRGGRARAGGSRAARPGRPTGRAPRGSGSGRYR